MKVNRILSFFFVALLCVFFSANVDAVNRQKTKHVILVGLDGWGAFSVPDAEMPVVKSLMANGSHTLKKRSVLPSSSAPNWASMFMGAPVELHGYTKWGSKTPELPSRELNSHGIFPTVFSVMREQRPSAEVGVLCEWSGISHLVDTLSLSTHKVVPLDSEHPDALCKAAEDYIIEKRPELLAICFDDPDHTGHKNGFGTPEYYEKLKVLDTFVGRIIDATKKAGIYDDSIIIVTADHGGIEKNHGGITLQEMETPFIVIGKGIKKGSELLGSMMQYDVASTIAYMLGLSQPQVWTGRPMIEIFE